MPRPTRIRATPAAFGLFLLMIGMAGCSSSNTTSKGKVSMVAPPSIVCGHPFFSTEAIPQTLVVHAGDHLTATALKAASGDTQYPPFLVIVASQSCSQGEKVTILAPDILSVLATARASNGLATEVAIAGGHQSGTGEVLIGPSDSPTATVTVPVL